MYTGKVFFETLFDASDSVKLRVGRNVNISQNDFILQNVWAEIESGNFLFSRPYFVLCNIEYLIHLKKMRNSRRYKKQI